MEVDETYIGKASFAEGREPVSGPYHKRTILGLVERGGRVRTFHAEGARAQEIAPIVRENLAREAKIMTDKSKIYTKLAPSSPRTSPSTTAPRNGLDTLTSACSPRARNLSFTPTPLKVISAFSSAA